ncbi:MAG: glycosyltransferase family 2 protein [bacterium]|nr:glycosyltransferase family 2 protein [bacterium]
MENTNNTKEILSIVIPAYNSAKTLEHTLGAILKQEGNYIKETIVVDSSDNGQMEEFIKKYEPKGITFINAGVRVMPAIGRNIGAKAATGKLLLFFDADVIPRPDYMGRIVEAYNAGYLAGGGSVDIPEFQKRNLVALAQLYIQVNEYLPGSKNRVKEFVTGCNNYCEREIFDKVGGYPEIRASEDVLYGLNVSKETPFWFLPGAVVGHIFRENWDGFLNNQKMLGKYVAVYRRQHSDSIIFKGIMPILLFPAFFGMKIIRIVPRAIAAGWVHAYRLLKVMPIFMLGLLYWTIGFTKESMQKSE